MPRTAAAPLPLGRQMYDAITNGNIAKVTELLDAGFNVNTEYSGYRPITFALGYKRKEIVMLLLSRGATVNPEDLTTAVVSDCPDMILLIRQKGIHANAMEKHRPIMYASVEAPIIVHAKSVEGVKALLSPVDGSDPADIHASYNNEGDILSIMDHFVINYTDIKSDEKAFDIAEFLMKQGADPMPKSKLKYTIIHCISQYDRKIPHAKALAIIDYVKTHHKELLNVVYKKGHTSHTPFGFACDQQRNAIAKKFLTIPEVDINKGTPAPIYECDLSMFNILLDRRDLDLAIEKKTHYPEYLISRETENAHAVNTLLMDMITSPDSMPRGMSREYPLDERNALPVFRKLLQRLKTEGKQQYMVEPMGVDGLLPLERAANKNLPLIFAALLEFGAPVVAITDRMQAKYDAGGYSQDIRRVFLAVPPPRTAAAAPRTAAAAPRTTAALPRTAPPANITSVSKCFDPVMADDTNISMPSMTVFYIQNAAGNTISTGCLDKESLDRYKALKSFTFYRCKDTVPVSALHITKESVFPTKYRKLGFAMNVYVHDAEFQKTQIGKLYVLRPVEPLGRIASQSVVDGGSVVSANHCGPAEAGDVLYSIHEVTAAVGGRRYTRRQGPKDRQRRQTRRRGPKAHRRKKYRKTA